NCTTHHIKSNTYTTPLFINSEKDIEAYFFNRKKYLQTDFYIHQRKRLNILIDANQKPIGGKWSYDTENRLKYPKNRKS
ncbi:cryptochrome/photolyase family protein, partial [Acinetobacter baumannii]